MDFKSIHFSYYAKLDSFDGNLDSLFDKLQLSDIIQCIKYKKEYKCHAEKHKTTHVVNKSKKKKHFVSFCNCISVVINYETFNVNVRLFKSRIVVNGLIQNNINLDNLTKYIIDQLQLNCNHSDLKIVIYTENWIFSTPIVVDDLNFSKQENYSIMNDYDFSLALKSKSKFSLLHIYTSKIMFQSHCYKEIQTEKNNFIEFVKEVFNIDIGCITTFELFAETANRQIIEQEINKFVDDNIVITIEI